ncbi:MAG: hypothetical protein AVDCRST_MAG71-415, partial [uncultured Lysobacter sp.]
GDCNACCYRVHARLVTLASGADRRCAGRLEHSRRIRVLRTLADEAFAM